MSDCPQSLRDKLASRGYECIRLLGKGGFAKVYLVKYNNEELALKVINLDKAPDKKTSYDQFQNELKVMEALHESKNSFCHYVVQYPKEFWRDDNMIFIPMRLAVSNLNDFLKEHKSILNIDLLKNIFCQITKGLECLYKLGFVYTDLKLENILIMSNMEIRIADLGSSYPLDEKFDFYTSTLHTASPESIKKDEPLTEKSMSFSLGMLALDLFKGRTLYDDSKWNETIYTINLTDKRISFQKEVKELNEYRIPLTNKDMQKLDELVVKLLKKDPKQRPTLKQVMCNPFLKSIKCCPDKDLLQRLLGR